LLKFGDTFFCTVMFKTPFKSIGHYVFDYKPRYYNERKERLNALEDRYARENEKKNQFKEDFQNSLSKTNLKNEWSKTKTSPLTDKNSTYRLAVIIIMLCLITWSFFNFDKIINARFGIAKISEAFWTYIVNK